MLVITVVLIDITALTAAFLIAGLSAWQLLRRTATEGTRRALRAAVVVAELMVIRFRRRLLAQEVMDERATGETTA